ncbi:MAG: hypothetical protein WC683_17770 [bacterium]|jgi:flagellar motor switch/type III secretory pathway protein FliN
MIASRDTHVPISPHRADAMHKTFEMLDQVVRPVIFEVGRTRSEVAQFSS